MTTKTTHALAAELHLLAEKFLNKPDATIGWAIMLIDAGWGDKDASIALAKSFPTPFNKEFTDDAIKLKHTSGILEVSTEISRKHVCRLVKPAQEAVYECESLLSDDEEKQLTGDTISTLEQAVDKVTP